MMTTWQTSRQSTRDQVRRLPAREGCRPPLGNVAGRGACPPARAANQLRSSCSAAGTPFEGGLFRMRLAIGPEFPNAPPKGEDSPSALHQTSRRW